MRFMNFNTVVNEMMEFCENSVERYYNGWFAVNEQLQELAAGMLPGMMGGDEDHKKMVLDQWAKAFGGILCAFKSYHVELFNEMNPDRIFKQNIEAFWHHAGIARQEETRMLKDQLEHLEAQLAEYLKQDRDAEAAKHLEESGTFVLKDDIRPFEEALSGFDDLLERVQDVDNLRTTVTQLKQDMRQYLDEIGQVKKLVAQITPQLSTLTTAIEKLSNLAGNAQTNNAK